MFAVRIAGRMVGFVVALGLAAGCLWLSGFSTPVATARVDNSQAQLNLAQSTAVVMDAQGEYAVNIARATQIVADSDWGPINTFQAGQSQGFGAGFGLAFIGFVVFGLMILLAIAAGRK